MSVHLAWFLLCSILVCFPWKVWGGEPWQVKRRNRKVLILRKLHHMLAHRPLSRYAFRKLLQVHRFQDKSLIRLYRKKQKQSPRRISYVIVLARLYLRARKYRSARPLLLQALQRYPRSVRLQWYTAQCDLKLGQKQIALARLHKLFPYIRNPKNKRRALKQMLALSLELQARGLYHVTYQKVRSLWWSREDRLWLSRLLLKYKQSHAAQEQLHRAIRTSRGRHKLSLLLELTRLQIQLREYRKALVTIRRVQRYGRRQSWIHWEVLHNRIAIHRGLGSLPAFLSRLQQRWKNTKDVKKLYVLARQFSQLGETSKARTFYDRILALAPNEKFARLWLFQHHAKKKRCVLAEKELRQLASRGFAQAMHYMTLGESCLRLSKRPMIERWTTSWPHIYRRFCSDMSSDYELARTHHLASPNRTDRPTRRIRSWRSKYRQARRNRRLLWRHSRSQDWRSSHRMARRWRQEWRSDLYFVSVTGRYERQIKKDRLRCSKRSWRKASLLRWRSWEKRSTREQRENYRVAVRLFSRLMRQFPQNWDHLYRMERLLTRSGAWVQQAHALRLLIQATGPDIEHLKAMEQLLLGLGKRMSYVELLRRLIKNKNLSHTQAYALAQYARKPMFLSPRTWEGTSDFLTRQKRWSFQIKPLLCKLLQRTLKHQPKGKQAPTIQKLYNLASTKTLNCPTLRRKEAQQ
ncbi:MAG: tetratricopeptide repeat protein [Deltaproteobacteria bacterium]|nr:MAG: tetratricopeptide repeat protein [Deltaproteobacteria bacterium]